MHRSHVPKAHEQGVFSGRSALGQRPSNASGAVRCSLFGLAARLLLFVCTVVLQVEFVAAAQGSEPRRRA